MNKRRQVTNEKLQNQLLEMTRECDSLRLNNQRLRDNLMRMEKERNALEFKLKSANGKKIKLPFLFKIFKSYKFIMVFAIISYGTIKCTVE